MKKWILAVLGIIGLAGCNKQLPESRYIMLTPLDSSESLYLDIYRNPITSIVPNNMGGTERVHTVVWCVCEPRCFLVKESPTEIMDKIERKLT